jgi:hypothetical protein
MLMRMARPPTRFARRLADHVRGHAVGYLALFFALGGVSYAAIPDADGTIHGCYDTSQQLNGASPLYVVDKAVTPSCPAGRSAPMTGLDWNGKGVPGPPGPEGPKGDSTPPPDDGTGKPGQPPSQTYGETAPGPEDLLGNGLGKKLVYKQTQCPPGAYDGPNSQVQVSFDCGQTTQVRCPRKLPVAVSGGYAIFYNGIDSTAFAKKARNVDMSVLYSARLASQHGGPQGWTASVSISDDKFIDLGYPVGQHFVGESFPGGWNLRVWALCGKKQAGVALGINVVAP